MLYCQAFYFSLSKRSNKDVSKANGIVLAGAAVTDNSSGRRRKHNPPESIVLGTVSAGINKLYKCHVPLNVGYMICSA